MVFKSEVLDSLNSLSHTDSLDSIHSDFDFLIHSSMSCLENLVKFTVSQGRFAVRLENPFCFLRQDVIRTRVLGTQLISFTTMQPGVEKRALGWESEEYGISFQEKPSQQCLVCLSFKGMAHIKTGSRKLHTQKCSVSPFLGLTHVSQLYFWPLPVIWRKFKTQWLFASLKSYICSHLLFN